VQRLLNQVPINNIISLADHDPVQLVEKLKTKYLVEWNAKLEFFPDKPGWTPEHWLTTWLPFGYMCLHNIAAKYVDTGVTDAITKHDAYVASKTFKHHQVGFYCRARLGWVEKHGN
jgi:hypothetical protein